MSEWGRAWMSEQLFESKHRAVEMITENATTRYLKLIKEKPQVIRQAPLKQIASYLGVTDTSLIGSERALQRQFSGHTLAPACHMTGCHLFNTICSCHMVSDSC